jgi:hypothetical protein
MDNRHNGTSFRKGNWVILIILIEGVVVYFLPPQLELTSLFLELRFVPLSYCAIPQEIVAFSGKNLA